MDIRHTFAIPTGANYTDPAILLDDAYSMKDALRIVRENGFTVIEEGDGGSYDSYDASDAPGIYGYEPDGYGAYSITVVA